MYINLFLILFPYVYTFVKMWADSETYKDILLCKFQFVVLTSLLFEAS